MFRRALVSVLGLAIGLTTARAYADVTVLYAAPGPPAPLVASVVPRSEAALPEAALPEPAPSEPVRTERARAASETSTTPEPPRAAPAPRPTPPDPSSAPAAHPSSGDALRIVRNDGDEPEEIVITLLDAEGRPDPSALEALSILARPARTERPNDEELASHRDDLAWVSRDLRRLHPALLLRLEQLRRAFPGHPIELISGLRTDGAESSRHRSGRALDVRVVGVSIEALDRLARTLPETGVGLCPASGLVHLDIRARSAHWIDLHP